MEKRKSTKKSKVKIYTEKGGLQGYSISDTMTKRRSILKKLLRKTPYSTVIKRLNVLAIYNKNRYPKITSKIKKDMLFLQKSRSGKKRSSMKKRRSMKKSSSMKKRRSMKKGSSIKKGGQRMNDFCCPRRGMYCRRNMML